MYLLTEESMVEVKKLFYKILFRLFIFNKHKRKKLYICLSKAGIAKYRALAGLSAEEYKSGKKFKYFIAVACIIKNEGPYLKEWLEYHKLIGVEHFYVYDNESTDDTKDILKPYIDSGEVTYIYYPGRDKQDEAYLDACRNFADETQWLAVIDLDEFIVLHKNSNLQEFMAAFYDCSQVSLHWVIYGSSGYEEKPDGLVLENFTKHEAKPQFTPKSIFNPRTVMDCGAHYMWCCGKWVDENNKEFGAGNAITANKAQINHYVIKSWEEFYKRKAARGCVNATQTFGEDLRKYFDEWDKNEVDDRLMQPYADKLKEKGL